MQPARIEKLEPAPSKVSLIFWNFVISVAGLVALLAIPVVMQHQYDRLHRELEEHVEPANHQVDYALQRAYEARNYALSSYFSLADTPHDGFTSPAAYYADWIADWSKQAQNEAHMAFCGPAALRSWR